MQLGCKFYGIILYILALILGSVYGYASVNNQLDTQEDLYRNTSYGEYRHKISGEIA